MSRIITYCEALCEATSQCMEEDSSVFIYGIGVPDHKKIFGSTNGLVEKFGKGRCFDTPLSEDSMLGIGLGAAMNGLRPINVHIRVDFLLLAMNQLVNMVSNIRYSSGEQVEVPLVIRAVIGRGWGQGSQHSKILQSIFAHIPGLKVVMPTTPYDAKGLLISAIHDNGPVIILEHRWLYWQHGDVPKEMYEIPIGKGNIIKTGTDLTIIATSWMCVEAFHAAKILKNYNINVEIVDPRSICPLDIDLIIQSVSKTKKCIIIDNDWVYCGFSSEVSSQIYEKCFNSLDCPIVKIGFIHTPCPTSRHLENKFYPNASNIIRAVEKIFNLSSIDLSKEDFYAHENKFMGPF